MRVVLLAAGLLVGVAPMAGAQQPCGPLAELVQTLQDRYGERPVFLGDHATEDHRLMVYLNPATGTWTVFATEGGIACLMANGVAGALAGAAS